MRFIKSFCLSFIFILLTMLHAQQYIPFNHLTVDDGLSQSSVTCILQHSPATTDKFVQNWMHFSKNCRIAYSCSCAFVWNRPVFRTQAHMGLNRSTQCYVTSVLCVGFSFILAHWQASDFQALPAAADGFDWNRMFFLMQSTLTMPNYATLVHTCCEKQIINMERFLCCVKRKKLHCYQ